jgi:uncharacterized protein (TIGR02996 family)
MHPADAAFLRAIREQPDDDLPRLIYADYLDERGDPRGEFIRVQCLLEGLAEDNPRYEELKRREAELLTDENWSSWGGHLRPFVYSWQFRRGFVEKVWISNRSLLANAPQLFRLAPIQRVTVYVIETWPAQTEWAQVFCKAPWLGRLLEIQVDSTNGPRPAAERAALESRLGDRVRF